MKILLDYLWAWESKVIMASVHTRRQIRDCTDTVYSFVPYLPKVSKRQAEETIQSLAEAADDSIDLDGNGQRN